MNLEDFFDNSDHADVKPADKPADTAPKPQDIATAFDKPKEQETDGQTDEREVQSESDDDRAAKLFGEHLHDQTHLIPLDTEGVDADQLAEANTVFRTELTNIGIANPKTGAELVELLSDAWHAPLSDDDLAAEKTQTAGELAHTYGIDGARERIDLAKQVLARSPMLKNAVDVLELGNSYDLINTLANIGFELRKSGKLLQ